MGYQECSVGRDVKVDMKSLREQKRLEAEGTSGDTVCMVLLTFFFGCKLATEEGRSRSILTVSWLWGALSGPWGGILVAVAQEERQFLLPGVCTLVLFLASLLVVVAPQSYSLARVWVLVGLVWMASGWTTFLLQNFTDKSDIWMSICLVQTLTFAVTAALPVFITDPLVHGL